MAFSYTFFLALLLLAPGFALWAGLRLGERREILSPAPDKPGSTTTLLTIIAGAFLGHLALASFYAIQAALCARTSRCIALDFDPNVYRSMLRAGHGPPPSDMGIAIWFGALALPAALVGLLAMWLARNGTFSRLLAPITFGWLWPLIQDARNRKGVVLAYVVTTLSNEETSVGYEGVVEQIAFDDNKGVAMLFLSSCDRFVVKVTETDVERVDTRHEKIEVLQLTSAQIANVAFEVFSSDSETGEPAPSEATAV